MTSEPGRQLSPSPSVFQSHGTTFHATVFSNRWRRTLLDKLVGLLFDLSLETAFYLVADAYYASRKVALPLLDQGHHLVSRLRSTATAYEPVPPRAARRRGQCGGSEAGDGGRDVGSQCHVWFLLRQPPSLRYSLERVGVGR